VDELIRDKIEAENEKKLREKEQKDIIAKQVLFSCIFFKNLFYKETVRFYRLFDYSSNTTNIINDLYNMYPQFLPIQVEKSFLV
jgi:hypothetical protein